ncbi:hypothetical protein ACLOJK_025094 [Asimina triloba]
MWNVVLGQRTKSNIIVSSLFGAILLSVTLILAFGESSTICRSFACYVISRSFVCSSCRRWSFVCSSCIWGGITFFGSFQSSTICRSFACYVISRSFVCSSCRRRSFACSSCRLRMASYNAFAPTPVMLAIRSRQEEQAKLRRRQEEQTKLRLMT